MNVTRAQVEQLVAQLSPEDEAALAASMARHPAGKRRALSQCPTCGQNASGALGDPALAIAL